MRIMALNVITLISCLFLLSVSNVVGLEYEFDFNDNGIFEYEGELGNIGDTVAVDIWLDRYYCDFGPIDELSGAQLYFQYDPAVLQVNDTYPNDSNHGGPFDPELSGFLQVEPGVYSLLAGYFGTVIVSDGKIKLGTIQLERIASGGTHVKAANDLGFGGYDDGKIWDCENSNVYPQDVIVTITVSKCEGNFDCDPDVDGTDAATFKDDFGRSQFNRPCTLQDPCIADFDGDDDVDGSDAAVFKADFGRGGYNNPCPPCQRFEDNGNGTVIDCESGLIWLKDANCFGGKTFNTAYNLVLDLTSGSCSLSDGSEVGDWRLPPKYTWETFMCADYTNPAVCNTTGTGQWTEGDPFVNIQETSVYWSGDHSGTDAWVVDMKDGHFFLAPKSFPISYVWPNRDPFFMELCD